MQPASRPALYVRLGRAAAKAAKLLTANTHLIVLWLFENLVGKCTQTKSHTRLHLPRKNLRWWPGELPLFVDTPACK